MDSTLSPCDMGSVDFSTTIKLDLENDYEAQVRDSVDSAPHSSQEIESFGMLHHDTESVKNSFNSPIHDSLAETGSLEGSADLYMDKSVTACEPEHVMCHKETSYNIIKDICVDEGVHTNDKITFWRKVDENIHKTYSSRSYGSKETVKDNAGISLLNPSLTDESEQSKDLMQLNEGATRKLADNVYKEIVVPEDNVLLQDLDREKSRTSTVEGNEIRHDHAKVDNDPEFHSQPDKSKTVIENDAVFSSPALESKTKILGSSSSLQQNENMDHKLDHSGHGSSQVSDCNCGQTQDAGVNSDEQGVKDQVFPRLDESSSFSVGYLGPLPYCGSISLRSDSSTASSRSFAFPILQSEWNSSPARLTKSGSRRRSKQQGWTHRLFCCKF
ncbi:uncharacterized protein HKW66_Vig0038090 [Vigna angularis]|uniref:18S pre-ribosomal assembly protein gar2-like protein n=4 Tax=Phaseolus angularis TaxID=3914 RepID=A0A8T0LA81_PHAAN|nr:uncharacterized protein LOC108338734 isoform X1 [Vigna angularis]XP_017431297.1 uncharacterized protein LOC108338734 isoform X1 [Vigna angularis]XP_017431301.1 uncharacterized protein LOC108338734 isoform X1 [Vigna angularis]XP_052737009.1 uncharacterized protein LOC108338734 isoform X1 [Vigna angularis]XP_052737021.1 uncharacterized protein LOC108338734 isoform X1 [Vigna angularis]BAT75184.1 hypothetical protein VIGAN_01300700 [Vigna angularis var. angularis]KAG2408987.1 uncharacterized p